MKNVFRIVLILCSFCLFQLHYLPIAFTILSVFIIKLVIAADKIQKDKGVKDDNMKYFLVFAIYLSLFLLIYFFMKFQNLPMGQLKVF